MKSVNVEISEKDPIIIEVIEAVGQPGKDGAGTALTVKNLDGTGEVKDVDTIIFDQSTGISATDLGDKKVKVSLGSSFKTWKVAGQESLVAEGEDELEIVAGDNITLETNPNAPKTLTINASGGGGGGGSIVNGGTIDGDTEATYDLFFNTEQQALKVFIFGSWITLAQVSFDSLWDSNTDVWDSTSMTWDSPLS